MDNIKKESVQLMQESIKDEIAKFKKTFGVHGVRHNKGGVHITLYIPYETASKLKGALHGGLIDSLSSASEGIVNWIKEYEEKIGMELPKIDPKTPLRRKKYGKITEYERKSRAIVRSLEKQLSLLEDLEKEL